jgi:Protein of unknown function (DUF3558)
MKIQTRPVAGLLIAGIMLAACSGSAPATTAGAPGASNPVGGAAGAASAASAANQSAAPAQGGKAIDACALITEQEATAFLGSDPGPGVNSGTADAPACSYGSLGILVAPTDGQAEFTTKTSALQGTTNFFAITGVGDGAGATIVANTIADLEFYKGSVGISVEVQGDPSLQNITLAALTTLGTTIAGRL